jgi:hypothetical protein
MLPIFTQQAIDTTLVPKNDFKKKIKTLPGILNIKN